MRGSGLDWTIVRPPRLTDRDLTGRYRVAYGRGLRGARTVSRADVAACMLRLIDGDAAVRRHVTVAN